LKERKEHKKGNNEEESRRNKNGKKFNKEHLFAKYNMTTKPRRMTYMGHVARGRDEKYAQSFGR
jgi:hypothetical protein